jgi:glutamyl-tRNA synthetase
MSVRVRFAPSPTGYLHVGGARTALFNWLLARKTQGTFVLRIEDTDVERSSDEMVSGILQAMSWMGLDWDEGPYHQSERLPGYRRAAMQLVEDGKAYYCFCSPELLANKRNQDPASKAEWKYDRTCSGLGIDEVRARLDRGEAGAVRFRVPEEKVGFVDRVFGSIDRGHDEIEDFVLLRSDGHPTYHLSVVLDDIDMRISHVVRGADHISNTSKQVLLYRALGQEVPLFVHVPLILGPDKSRLSKRHGATSVLAYRDQGVLPEAFRNYLALLGWSPGDDRELFGKDELIEAFSPEGISKANAVFDPDKLSWFNGQCINSLDVEELVRRLRPNLEETGVWEERFGAGDAQWLASVIALIRPRFRSLSDLAGEVRTYVDAEIGFDPAAIARFMKDPKLAQYLPELASRLESVASFDLAGTEATVRGLAGELEVKAGLLINASRVALTGKAVAPGMFDVMVVLGRDKTVSRLRRAASEIFA